MFFHTDNKNSMIQDYGNRQYYNSWCKTSWKGRIYMIKNELSKWLLVSAVMNLFNCKNSLWAFEVKSIYPIVQNFSEWFNSKLGVNRPSLIKIDVQFRHLCSRSTLHRWDFSGQFGPSAYDFLISSPIEFSETQIKLVNLPHFPAKSLKCIILNLISFWIVFNPNGE